MEGWQKLLEDGKVYEFYYCRAWRRLRRSVLEKHRGECQDCKAKGRYTKATDVHHVRPVRQYPDLAMSETYTDTDGCVKDQLIPLCNQCHKERDNQRTQAEPLTEERW